MLHRFKKMMGELGKLSLQDWLELIMHPVLLPFMLIPAWSKSLWASRILLWGQWSRYNGFHAQNSINSLFYRTQWININRYGRLGNSPIIGLGNFPLSNWWHLSSLASYFYANAGAVTTLLGTLSLVLTHTLWLQSSDPLWVAMVTLVLFFSSTIYGMAFARQNYQILAWMFMPVILFGLLNGQWVIATMALLAASVLGITAFIVGSLFVLVATISQEHYLLMLILLPSVLVVSLKLTPLFFNGNLSESFLSTGKLIGLVHSKVRYKRTSMRMSLFNIYFIVLYGSGLILIWGSKGVMPMYLLVSYLLFIFNQRFIRFADGQSVIVVFTLVAALEVLIMPFNIIALLGLVIIANPLARVFQLGKHLRPEVFKPFDIEKLLVPMRNFLDIPRHSKVYFAFDDPEGIYENLFDGYRILLEVPLLVAAEKEFHLFPDWYAVQETNYLGAPSIWGRSKATVEKNLGYWSAGYVIVYQENMDLDKEWIDSFDLISMFSWKDYHFNLEQIYSRDNICKHPFWFLLKYRN